MPSSTLVSDIDEAHTLAFREDPDALKEAVIERLDAEYVLVEPDHRDELTDEQVRALLGGKELDVNEWYTEARDNAAWDIVERVCEDDEFDVLRDADLILYVEEAVRERDQSDPLNGLMRQTNRVFRYSLDCGIDTGWGADTDEIDEAVRDMAEAAKLDLADPDTDRALRGLVANASYGGRLYVFFDASVDDAVDLARPEEGTKTLGTATFGTPTLVVLDGFNGSGHEVRLGTDITVPWVTGRVHLDAGPYSWADVCGGSTGHDTTLTFTAAPVRSEV